MLLSHGFASLIGSPGKGFSIIRTDSTDELQRLVTTRKAGAVILNPGLVQGNTRILQSIRASSPGIRLIALVYAFHDESLLSLFDDRITINDSPDRILAALKDDAAVNDVSDTGTGSAALTDREIEVLRLLASGKATKEIAEELHISANTVITHRKNLSVKTGIRSVSGLAIYAVVKKYITPGGSRI